VRVVLSKVLFAIGTLLFVLVFNFFLFRIAGDPIKDLIRGNPRLSEAGRERLIKERGLREGYLTQFRIYVSQTLHGNLGVSFQTNQPVSTMIRKAMPNTLILVGTSTILAVMKDAAAAESVTIRAKEQLDPNLWTCACKTI